MSERVSQRACTVFPGPGKKTAGDVGNPRARLCAVLLIALLLGAGFGIGSNHRWLLTCQDFEVSGNSVPADCRTGEQHRSAR